MRSLINSGVFMGADSATAPPPFALTVNFFGLILALFCNLVT